MDRLFLSVLGRTQGSPILSSPHAASPKCSSPAAATAAAAAAAAFALTGRYGGRPVEQLFNDASTSDLTLLVSDDLAGTRAISVHRDILVARNPDGYFGNVLAGPEPRTHGEYSPGSPGTNPVLRRLCWSPAVAYALLGFMYRSCVEVAWGQLGVVRTAAAEINLHSLVCAIDALLDSQHILPWTVEDIRAAALACRKPLLVEQCDRYLAAMRAAGVDESTRLASFVYHVRDVRPLRVGRAAMVSAAPEQQQGAGSAVSGLQEVGGGGWPASPGGGGGGGGGGSTYRDRRLGVDVSDGILRSVGLDSRMLRSLILAGRRKDYVLITPPPTGLSHGLPGAPARHGAPSGRASVPPGEPPSPSGHMPMHMPHQDSFTSLTSGIGPLYVAAGGANGGGGGSPWSSQPGTPHGGGGSRGASGARARRASLELPLLGAAGSASPPSALMGALAAALHPGHQGGRSITPGPGHGHGWGAGEEEPQDAATPTPAPEHLDLLVTVPRAKLTTALGGIVRQQLEQRTPVFLQLARKDSAGGLAAHGGPQALLNPGFNPFSKLTGAPGLAWDMAKWGQHAAGAGYSSGCDADHLTLCVALEVDGPQRLTGNVCQALARMDQGHFVVKHDPGPTSAAILAERQRAASAGDLQAASGTAGLLSLAHAGAASAHAKGIIGPGNPRDFFIPLPDNPAGGISLTLPAGLALMDAESMEGLELDPGRLSALAPSLLSSSAHLTHLLGAIHTTLQVLRVAGEQHGVFNMPRVRAALRVHRPSDVMLAFLCQTNTYFGVEPCTETIYVRKPLPDLIKVLQLLQSSLPSRARSSGQSALNLDDGAASELGHHGHGGGGGSGELTPGGSLGNGHGGHGGGFMRSRPSGADLGISVSRMRGDLTPGTPPGRASGSFTRASACATLPSTPPGGGSGIHHSASFGRAPGLSEMAQRTLSRASGDLGGAGAGGGSRGRGSLDLASRAGAAAELLGAGGSYRSAGTRGSFERERHAALALGVPFHMLERAFPGWHLHLVELTPGLAVEEF